MKLLTLLPGLLATAYASSPSAEAEASASSASIAESVAAASPSADPTPVGALWTSTWDASTLSPYKQSCASKRSFRASLFTLNALYPDLERYATGLKKFYANTHYPGSWSGVDAHGLKRELLKMETAALPKRVRDWIEKEEEQKHFAVLGDTVFFAPGAIYPIAPLWVEGEGEECQDVFDDLATYSNEPKDGVVIGKVTHEEAGEGEVDFTVEALRVKLKEGEKDEL